MLVPFCNASRSTCEYSGVRSCSYRKEAESEAFGVKREGQEGPGVQAMLSRRHQMSLATVV